MIQVVKQLTLSDFLQLPETKPINEYIEGKIYPKPMPKGKHSAIQTFLTATINQIGILPKKCGAFSKLRCTLQRRSLLPDISVFTWQNIPRDEQREIKNNVNISPNWIIEILSPQQSSIRVIDNILFCLSNGTELGWLIDPEERIIMTFAPNKQPESKQNQDQLIVPSFISDWQISVQDVFNYLRFN